MTTAEPERLVLRRLLPFAPVVGLLAFAMGLALGDEHAAWSALVGIAVVTANLMASAYPLAWAARISPTAVYVAGLGGFVLRLVVILVILVILDATSWFSPVAFVMAVVPATIVTLVAELRLLADRRLQADLWYFRSRS